MPSIVFTERQRHELLEPGDLIIVDEETSLWFVSWDDQDTRFMLVDATTMRVVSSDIKHAVHAVNHLKKHYSETFKIIKSDRITITIEVSR